ncbi:UNVERIFIED_CONTAM: hypothetical protein HDU68_011392 [Siphonaria sp. JEL0065]|nr:hypothetical protein HDU68_011392 [Siphonaria sp. JEL0065]
MQSAEELSFNNVPFVDINMESSVPLEALENVHIPLPTPLERFEGSLVSLSSLESLADCFEGLDATNQKVQSFSKFDNLNLTRLAHIPFKVEQRGKKRAKKGKNDDMAFGEEWKCVSCGAGEADTPLKRKGPDKKRNYCNACYVRWRVKVERSERGSARPVVPPNAVPMPASAAVSSRRLESQSSRASLTSNNDSDQKVLYHPYHQGMARNKSSTLSLTSPSEMLGVAGSMATTFIPKSCNKKSNNESPSTTYFQSPQYTSYEWNNSTTGDMMFPQYLPTSNDPNHRFDTSIMHEYTPSPMSRLGSIPNMSPPELGAFPSSFHFGVPATPDVMFSGNSRQSRLHSVNNAIGHIGVPANSWTEDCNANNNLYQTYQHQLNQQQLLQQQQQLQQQFTNQLEQHQHQHHQNQQHEQQRQQQQYQHQQELRQLDAFAADSYQRYPWQLGAGKPVSALAPTTTPSVNNTNTSLHNNTSELEPVPTNSNNNNWSTSLDSQSDPTYLPVFDGSTTEVDYNQLLGYGADVTSDLDASTHEFLYGGATAGISGTQFDDQGNDLQYPQQYQYEPVSHWFHRQEPQTDFPLTVLPEGRQQSPQDQIAAAYFGESAKLFFGPHFITNGASLNPVITIGSSGDAVNPGGGSGAVPAGPFSRLNPLNWMSSPTSQLHQPNQQQAASLNLEARLTEDELMEISRLYRQAPLGDVNLTSTLQSLTNLRKSTLKMTPIEVSELSAPSHQSNTKHLLEFTFDASTPCIIRIHYVSKEVLVLQDDGSRKLAFAPRHWRTLSSRNNSNISEAKDGSIVVDGDNGVPLTLAVKDWPQLASKMVEKPVVKTYGPFGAGLGQKFVVPEVDAFDSGWFSKEELGYGVETKSGVAVAPTSVETQQPASSGDGSERVNITEPEAAPSEPVEPETTTEQLLLDGEAIYYPMVIVMEALTDGVDQSNSFAEPNEKSTNIQVTYASLQESKDQSSYAVKVLKQKVLIDGIPYLLQDIFGYTDPTGTGASNPNLSLPAEDLQTMRECVVCMSELKDTIVLPCRHLCLCHTCGETLRMQGRNANGGALGSATAPKCPICRQTFESLLQISLPAPFRQPIAGTTTLSQQSSMVYAQEASTAELLE